jgi:prefoldin beta subunit
LYSSLSTEIEIVETDRALEELKKIGSQDPVYKSAGPILIKSQKEDLLKELGEKKETQGGWFWQSKKHG